MKIFYIDTTSSFLYAGVIENDTILAEVKKELANNMSEQSFLEIEKLFAEAKIVPKDLDKIILVNGPGSFTGTRIGVTIAKTLAWTLNIGVTTISSLFAMAATNKDKAFKIPLIDARRGYVFAAIYDEDLNQVLREQYMNLDVLEAAKGALGSDYLYISNNEFGLSPLISYNPDILEIVKLSKDKDIQNPHGVDANYLKLTEAEENKIDN